MPGDVRALVEAVYDDTEPEAQTCRQAGADPARMANARRRLSKDEESQRSHAANHL